MKILGICGSPRGGKSQMLEADGIVLASPVYLDHVTAQMKALLDRTSHFVHCLRLTGKYMAALTTSGGGGGEATMAFMKPNLQPYHH
ncbi:MAG: NAD(P)H-dependent oxidoreductase [bacterium]|jgi:multimeric flavodoxin WrbA